MKTKLTRIVLLLAALPLTPLVAQTKETKKEAVVKEKETVVKVVELPEPGTISTAIRDAATFSILSKALKAADLEATLGDSKGSYTIFAPTDEAFMKLKEGTLDKLLLPENKEKLRSLLLYHVIPGQMLAVDLKDGQVTTMNGDKVKIEVDDGKAEVGDAKVFSTDVMANNGVMHSIGTVMVPKSLENFSGLGK